MTKQVGDTEEVANTLRNMRNDVEVDRPSKSPPRYEIEAYKLKARRDLQAQNE